MAATMIEVIETGVTTNAVSETEETSTVTRVRIVGTRTEDAQITIKMAAEIMKMLVQVKNVSVCSHSINNNHFKVLSIVIFMVMVLVIPGNTAILTVMAKISRRKDTTNGSATANHPSTKRLLLTLYIVS